jgi:hypothetical protein
MSLVKLSSLFFIDYGSNLELNILKESKVGINFVSRTRKNNGVSAIIEPVEDKKPIPANTISVALGSSSVLYSFLQEKPYYSGRDVAYLTPKSKMSRQEMLYYCLCIQTNRFRYNFGRQANKTIDNLLVPDIKDIPNWVNNTEIKDLSHLNEKYNIEEFDISNINYKLFDFFEIFKFESETKHNEKKNVNLVSALTTNNGIKGIVSTDTYINGNKLSISSNGIYTGTAFYQENDFVLQDSLALSLKEMELNKYIGLYLVSILNIEKYRYNYGRKSGKSRLLKEKIYLPIDKQGKPKWYFMENYIKSLPYSKCL